MALRAIAQNPDADLIMLYFEQPDGSGHQFTLTDPRQATNPLDATTVGTPGNPPGAVGQDADKIARYDGYLKFAYQQANSAVEAILNAVGSRPNGEPLRDVFVVSDHGMAPFHTAVSLRNLLSNAGVNVNLLGLRTTGPAANVHVNLQGREAGGAVPNFYGAHGHNSELPSMSAILYAAGPSLKQLRKLDVIHNIDVAPTVMEILGVAPALTVDGAVIPKILRKQRN